MDLFFFLILIYVILLFYFVYKPSNNETFLIANCHQYKNDLTGIHSINHHERGSDPFQGVIDQSTHRSDCNHPLPDFSPFTYNMGNCCNIPGENTPLSEITCEMIKKHSDMCLNSINQEESEENSYPIIRNEDLPISE